jgi:hypothetical protein
MQRTATCAGGRLAIFRTDQARRSILDLSRKGAREFARDGVGRAKLRLSRGFPRHPRLQHHPPKINRSTRSTINDVQSERDL